MEEKGLPRPTSAQYRKREEFRKMSISGNAKPNIYDKVIELLNSFDKGKLK